MVSIGPTLPPHLQKRKRTPDEDSELPSPPPKASRRDHDDEIPLYDDSDDDYGPCAPGSSARNGSDTNQSRPGPTVGPSLPPAVTVGLSSVPAAEKQPIGPTPPQPIASINEDEIPLNDGSDSDSNEPSPAPPPLKPTVGPAAPPPKRVFGPAPPPADLNSLPTTDPNYDNNASSDSDDDDEWGPKLPTGSPDSRPITVGPAFPSTNTQSSQSSAPKRDDWMLAPPTSSDHRAPDPTKLRGRRFLSGPRATAAAASRASGGVSSVWTETPEEKARRLANAVLGREDPTAVTAASQSRPDRKESKPVDESRIREYVEQTRGRSLVEEYQARRAASAGKSGSDKESSSNGRKEKWGGGPEVEEEDDPSKRAFDWEKDMKIGGRLSGAQRRDIMKKAANLGGRFQRGNYL